MDLTLNDFRNILGKVNDGDAVFTKDNNGNATGIEKANYGKLRTHNVKGVTVDDSVMIREEFVAAIRRASGSGKLDIVNNHKTWTIFNHKSVDGTDAYAIRVAFAKAMEAGGLDKNAMKTVRKALGLGPGNTLSSGTAMTALTRQQVRELIDANITALNARRAPNNQLRTYDQLHAGYSAEEKRDIAAVREEINRTGGAPRILLNAELSDATAPRKAPVISERIEIKEEPPTESREAIAKRNLSTLAFLIAGHYHFDQDVATDILKQIEDWEEKLAECSSSGNPTDLTELNGDLRDFLLNNRGTIQPLIDQALADNRDE